LNSALISFDSLAILRAGSYTYPWELFANGGLPILLGLALIISFSGGLEPAILMQEFARRLFLASIIAVFGVVTVCGPALHALPGCAHPGWVQGPDQDSGQGSSSQSLANSPESCPICHFLAQGQYVVGSDRDNCTDIVRTRPIDQPLLPDAATIVLISIPRGPPLA
jgi:hypothetical protein